MMVSDFFDVPAGGLAGDEFALLCGRVGLDHERKC